MTTKNVYVSVRMYLLVNILTGATSDVMAVSEGEAIKKEARAMRCESHRYAVIDSRPVRYI